MFSGVANNGDPIAGREILQRVPNTAFDKLAHKGFLMKEAEESDLDPLFYQYFDHYPKNCLKASDSPTFSLDDIRLEVEGED